MRNWVYYMQEGLKSMWSKKPKGNKKYAIDLNDRTREEKIKKVFEPIDFKECGCLPDCGCKETKGDDNMKGWLP